MSDPLFFLIVIAGMCGGILFLDAIARIAL
jgi:hypothetical protein